MGSTDVTCAVSHLPIQYKEPCRFLFLRQVLTEEDQLEEGTCEHAWARWLPLSLPVKGLYDSYGRLMAGYREDASGHDSHHVKYEPDALLRFQIDSIARVALPLSHDLRDGFGDLKNFPNTIESLMTACERGWLRVRLPQNTARAEEEQTFQTVHVSPYYVSERAWQAMIASSEERGIGPWRDKLGRHSRDPVAPLRRMIDHYREYPDRRRRLREILERTETGPEERKDLLSALEDSFPVMLRDLTSHHEMMPDVLAVGGDWCPALHDRDVLYTFKEEDWAKFRELAFDLLVFTCTLRSELFREFHPELAQFQFYFPDTELIGRRMLLRYVEEWCLEIERKHEEQSGG